MLRCVRVEVPLILPRVQRITINTISYTRISATSCSSVDTSRAGRWCSWRGRQDELRSTYRGKGAIGSAVNFYDILEEEDEEQHNAVLQTQCL